MEPASKRPKDSAAQTTGAALPPDVVEEILLRVPATSLFRFRAVCRSWRSLVRDTSFLKAHAGLRPALILALAGAGDRIDVVDLSGNVVKQINVPAAEEEGVLPGHPGPFYLFRANNNRVRVVDPDTGAVSAALPVDDLNPPAGQWTGYWPQPCYTLWRDFSTGHRKVLRIATLNGYGRARFEQPCHVLTLGSDNDERRWRPRPSPPVCITTNIGAAGVIVQRFAYFLPDRIFPTFELNDRPRDARTMDLMKSVVSFNLDMEEWTTPTIRGPSAIDTADAGACRLKLVKLNNMLAMMHYDSKRPVVDLWFAIDLEKGLWVKKHSVPRELIVPYKQMCLHGDTKLLLALDDGRIAFSYYVTWTWPEGPHWLTQIYDPRTKACIDVPQRGVRGIVGMYTGSLLCLESE